MLGGTPLGTLQDRSAMVMDVYLTTRHCSHSMRQLNIGAREEQTAAAAAAFLVALQTTVTTAATHRKLPSIRAGIAKTVNAMNLGIAWLAPTAPTVECGTCGPSARARWHWNPHSCPSCSCALWCDTSTSRYISCK